MPTRPYATPFRQSILARSRTAHSVYEVPHASINKEGVLIAIARVSGREQRYGDALKTLWANFEDEK